MSFFLNKIGIYDKLFHLLWYKPEFLKTSGLNLNIPDTILFDKGQPLFWYYSNSSGRIMKKKSVLLNEIIDKFNEFPNKSGVLAYFISEVSFDEFHRPINQPEIRYFDKTLLSEFLIEKKDKFLKGILQRFIDPYSRNNMMISMLWGKNVTIITKRVNTKHLYNRKLDIYEKCCTFDGPEIYSEKGNILFWKNIRITIKKGFLTGTLSTEIMNTSNKIVEHINQLSYARFSVKNITFYYKQDNFGRIWLLWGSNMVYDHELKSNNEFIEQKIKLPDNIDRVLTVNLQKPMELIKGVKCLKCGRFSHKANFHELFYWEIIKEKNLLFEEKNEYFRHLEAISLNICTLRDSKIKTKTTKDQIPVIFRYIYPKIQFEDYSKLKNEASFYNKTVLVCEDCFYRNNRVNYLSGAECIGEKKLPLMEKAEIHDINLKISLKNLEKNVPYKRNSLKRLIAGEINLKKQSKKLQSFKKSEYNNYMSYSTNASITTSTMEDNFKIKPQNTTNYQKLIKIYESKEKVDEKLIISNQPYLNILEGLRK